MFIWEEKNWVQFHLHVLVYQQNRGCPQKDAPIASSIMYEVRSLVLKMSLKFEHSKNEPMCKISKFHIFNHFVDTLLNAICTHLKTKYAHQNV